MSKRYTEEDDRFIVAYFDAVGPMIGPHDLGRTEQSVKNRVKHLKETGAWDALAASVQYYHQYRKLAGFPVFEFE